MTATGTKSTSTYLRGDNTWATPPNTTYTEITSAEITAGTATTARAITGRRSEEIVTKALGKSYPVGSRFVSSVNTTPSLPGTWTQISANSGTVVVSLGGFSTPPTASVEPEYVFKRTA